MTIHIGIGGWTYEPWRGTFYPPKHPQKRELDYAGQHLTAIEINGTYYGSQKPESFANWAAAVPDGFKFSVKASRFCTNRKQLADGAASVEKFLTQGLTRLGDRLGPILWQFMATKTFDRDDFARFLDLLPEYRREITTFGYQTYIDANLNQTEPNIEGYPKFTFAESPLSDRIAWVDILFLGMWNILFFMGAYLSFLRYDVK